MCQMLSGAQHVGKTFAAHELVGTLTSYIDISLKEDVVAQEILSVDLDAQEMVWQFAQYSKIYIEVDSSLFFINEIRYLHTAFIMGRYFYTNKSELHVIATGSFLFFACEHIGIPVVYITQLYWYPLTYISPLVTMCQSTWANSITSNSKTAHTIQSKIIVCTSFYSTLGELPGVVADWTGKNLSYAAKKLLPRLWLNKLKTLASFCGIRS